MPFNSNGFKQGNYSPLRKEKYKGTYPIVYRSSYELALMYYLDNSSRCVSWGSESLVVPYVSPLDGRQHRYFVDFIAVFKAPDGSHKKFFIEVKPFKETLQPEQTKRKRQATLLRECQTYAVNQAKWSAAKHCASKMGADFVVLTERELFVGKKP